MSVLNTLKLVAATKPTTVNPVLQRRSKMLAKLAEQMKLAEAQAEGRSYMAERVRRVKDAATGEVRDVSSTKRVKPWFWTAENGKICIAVKYGSKKIELSKGKTAVEVGAAKDLPAVLATLRQAVEAGELDAQIEAVGAAVRKGFNR